MPQRSVSNEELGDDHGRVAVGVIGDGPEGDHSARTNPLSLKWFAINERHPPPCIQIWPPGGNRNAAASSTGAYVHLRDFKLHHPGEQ